MTEIAIHQPQTNLAEQVRYAELVSTGAMLPQAYRNKPADILLAIGLGQSMGLSPAESLYRIDVIQGKPTASAELIAANVRKAGHKLRVQGDDHSCTATIVRSDDPEFPFTVTRDVKWAQAMGLTSKDNYKKQPGTMLQWRAITAVARLACPEALYGVAYTADELGDMPGEHRTTQASASVFMPPADVPAQEPVDAEEVDDEPTPEQPAPQINARQRGKLFALFTQKGIAESEQLAGIAAIIQRPIESRTAMTSAEFDSVIARLEALPDALAGDLDE